MPVCSPLKTTLVASLSFSLSLLLACGDDTAPADAGGGDVSHDAGADASSPDVGVEATRIEQYLRGETAALQFVVHAFPGNEPSEALTGRFGRWVDELVDKPGGVSFVDGESLGAHPEAWTAATLRELAAGVYVDDPDGAVIINLFYVDGLFEQENVLGAAFSDRDFVIFRDRFESSCGGLIGGAAACEVAEETIHRHEFGHLIGLVNSGLPMQTPHEDPEHPGHDETEGCLMYFALETSIDSLLSGLATPQPIELCAESLADVRGFQGR